VWAHEQATPRSASAQAASVCYDMDGSREQWGADPGNSGAHLAAVLLEQAVVLRLLSALHVSRCRAAR
jgi:hypothetical protein